VSRIAQGQKLGSGYCSMQASADIDGHNPIFFSPDDQNRNCDRWIALRKGSNISLEKESHSTNQGADCAGRPERFRVAANGILSDVAAVKVRRAEYKPHRPSRRKHSSGQDPDQRQ
jgi:hypothetical protein